MSAKRLTNIIREKSPIYFRNLFRLLQDAYDKSHTEDATTWFSLCFEELIRKVGKDPSWESLSNILNCIDIVEKVAVKNYTAKVCVKFGIIT